MNVYEKFHVKNVINCSGKMTYLGSSLLSNEVSQAMVDASKCYVHMEELMDKAGEYLASVCGGEAGCISAGASAGIIISVAACITKGNPLLIEQVPFIKNLPNKILIQKGHMISFGASMNQMIQLGGGTSIEVGLVNKCLPYHLEEAIDKDVAAILYVKSHHAIQTDMISLDKTIEIAHKHNIPVIVDAAAEESLTAYLEKGADLVIYSGAKAFGGPTSGFIVGRKELIAMCRKQYTGVGRPMKVGKENILGLMEAVNIYVNAESNVEKQLKIVNFITEKLSIQNGIKVSIAKDVAGREIYRAKISVDESILGISAAEVDRKLRQGEEVIYTRNHHVDMGYFEIDPRPMRLGDEKIVVNRISEIIKL
jgi:L-seryl-tRNA(Ser) seleniumtransferase/D-glucosaminate-6-phosphate ammonia-lyase